jgi:DNA-binding MarR family transcriptional regulator
MTDPILSATQRKIIFLARCLRRHLGRYEASQKISSPAVSTLSLLSARAATLPQLARSMATSRQNIRGIIQNLCDRGLVVAERNPAHKSSDLYALTESGLRFLNRISLAVRRAEISNGRLLEAAEVLMLSADALLAELLKDTEEQIPSIPGVTKAGAAEEAEKVRKKARKAHEAARREPRPTFKKEADKVWITNRAAKSPGPARLEQATSEPSPAFPIQDWQSQEMDISML